jgi:SAM-dependent methyltransferase
VCDLAAGTGKLTRLLVPSGAQLIAVEPVREMRAQLERTVPQARVLEGLAESLPLGDSSVDCVTTAQAFHWFDYDRALPELARVIRPGGLLVVIQNLRDERDPLNEALNDVIGPFIPPEEAAERPWREVLDSSPVFGEPERRDFSFEQPLDVDRLVGRIASMSWIARLDEEPRTRVLHQIRTLGEAKPATFGLPYRTEVYLSERLG